MSIEYPAIICTLMSETKIEFFSLHEEDIGVDDGFLNTMSNTQLITPRIEPHRLQNSLREERNCRVHWNDKGKMFLMFGSKETVGP